MRLVIIGFGGMGNYHYNQIKKSKLIDIAGVYDIDAKRTELAKKLGIAIYDSAIDVAKDKSVDAVLIATPNDSHCEYVKFFASHKKHIICEKPVALNSQELKEMIDISIANKVIFTVHQNRRWDKDYLTVLEILKENRIGHIYKISSNVTGSHGVPGAWRKEKAKGGGMILDWGVHLIDQALMLNSSPVTSIYCKNQYVYGLEVDDGTEIKLTFGDGMEYSVLIDTNAFVTSPRWLIYGLDGSAIIKDWALRGKLLRVKVFFDAKNKGIQAGNGFTKTMANRSRGTIVKSRLPKVKAEAFAFYRNFVASVNGQEKQYIQHYQIVRVLKVLEDCFLSAEKQQVINVNI